MIRLPLTRGSVALLDDDDLPLVQGFKWHCTAGGYAARFDRRNRKSVLVLMHRVIANADPLLEVDHINGNGLDNRRENLRLCTRAQNAKNRKQNRNGSSRFKGVHRDKRQHCWRASICVDRRSVPLGVFQEEIQAAFAYDRAAVLYFGEFARVNFPQLRTA